METLAWILVSLLSLAVIAAVLALFFVTRHQKRMDIAKKILHLFERIKIDDMTNEEKGVLFWALDTIYSGSRKKSHVEPETWKNYSFRAAKRKLRSYN